jgi:hypothetical protein
LNLGALENCCTRCSDFTFSLDSSSLCSDSGMAACNVSARSKIAINRSATAGANPAPDTGAGVNRGAGAIGRPGSNAMFASNHFDGSIIHRLVGNEKRRSHRQPRSRGSLVRTGVADIGCCVLASVALLQERLTGGADHHLAFK